MKPKPRPPSPSGDDSAPGQRKMALEVHLPQVIGSRGLETLPGLVLPRLFRVDLPMAVQNGGDGAGRGNLRPAWACKRTRTCGRPRPDGLLGPATPPPQDPRCGAGAAPGATGAVRQAGFSFGANRASHL